jgi:hypothetical protein
VIAFIRKLVGSTILLIGFILILVGYAVALPGDYPKAGK